MNTDLNKIKDKLAKLIRLSEDSGATDGEISNAINAAQQLMARHNLSREDIDESNKSDPCQKVEMNRFRAFFHGKNRTAWECRLALFVVDFYGTIKYYSTSAHDLRGESRAVMMFYGPSDDSEGAAELFAELDSAIATMATIRFGGFARKDGAVYAEGFVEGLREKLVTEKLAIRQADAQTSALMVVSDTRALALRKKAESWLAVSCGIKLRQGSGLSGGSGSRDARSQGRADGRNYGVARKTPLKKLA